MFLLQCKDAAHDAGVQPLGEEAPRSPRKSSGSDSKSSLINWNYPSVSEPQQLYLYHFEAEVDPLQGKMGCLSNSLGCAQ